MELPITKPVKFSYADEIDINQLMQDIEREKRNCFIRVTSGSEEGYLLLKNGKKVAASYEKKSRGDAIKYIKSCLENPKTLVELFEIKPTQIDYLMEINKHYILDPDQGALDIIVELKKSAGKKAPKEEPPFKKVVSKYGKEIVEKKPPVKKDVSDYREKSFEKESPFKKVISDDEKKELSTEGSIKKLELEDRLEANLDTVIKKKASAEPIKTVDTSQKEEDKKLDLEDRLEANLDTVIEEKSAKNRVKPSYTIPLAEQISKPKISTPSTPEEEPKRYEIPKTRSRIDIPQSKNKRANLQASPRPKNEKLKVLSRREAMEIPSVIESEEKRKVEIKKEQPIPVIKKKLPEDFIKKEPQPLKEGGSLEKEEPQPPMESKEREKLVKEEPAPVRKKEPDYMKRSEIMKKYGIREVDEQEINNILSSYNGGIINDEDIEKVELTLMRNIKKSILSLSKIKGVEVMVFLDNTHHLQGTIKIISEFQGGGIISRFTGESKELDTLKQKIIGIAEIEVKKVFREYPEILDKFDIEVEIE